MGTWAGVIIAGCGHGVSVALDLWRRLRLRMAIRYVLARTGALAELGRFAVSTPRRYPRDMRAVCRTDRGLEIATVVCDVSLDDEQLPLRGELLRPVSRNDELILQRLERYRLRALEACQRLMEARGVSCILLDVEHLFDGESLYFHFLGTVDEAVQSLLDELAATYEKRVGYRQFVEKLAQGCGPNCGTTAAGCQTACAHCPAGGCGLLR